MKLTQLPVGEDIEFVRSAPLQDPAEYSVGGSLIALRRPDAARIYVALKKTE